MTFQLSPSHRTVAATPSDRMAGLNTSTSPTSLPRGLNVPNTRRNPNQRLRQMGSPERTDLDQQRRWERMRAGAAALCAAASLLLSPPPSVAAPPPGKLSATPQEVLEIVKADFTQRKYLITGDLTKEVYADDAHFADSNNDFGNGLDSWVRGVKLLFVSDRCKLALTDDVVLDEAARTITFKHWRQVDVFRIPGAPHTPVFTGRTVLSLDPVENIVVDHTEVWDQPPSEILKSLKFFDPNFNPPGFE